MERDYSKIQDYELGGVNDWDRPDYADAYIQAAYWPDGKALSETELDELNDDHSDLVHELLFDCMN